MASLGYKAAIIIIVGTAISHAIYHDQMIANKHFKVATRYTGNFVKLIFSSSNSTEIPMAQYLANIKSNQLDHTT